MTKRFSNPFQPLDLNDTAADELLRLAHMFVQDHISLYEQFLNEDNSRVGPQRWKFVSEQDGCRANTYGSSSGNEPVPLDDLNDR
ncbi:hypothetical protein PI125_g14760 [Phytophthora idaei]|nr:hypothetical protein PI125_g14760 [Phytophthora idaei]